MNLEGGIGTIFWTVTDLKIGIRGVFVKSTPSLVSKRNIEHCKIVPQEHPCALVILRFTQYGITIKVFHSNFSSIDTITPDVAMTIDMKCQDMVQARAEIGKQVIVRETTNSRSADEEMTRSRTMDPDRVRSCAYR